jgi:hypothetical protein
MSPVSKYRRGWDLTFARAISAPVLLDAQSPRLSIAGDHAVYIGMPKPATTNEANSKKEDRRTIRAAQRRIM